MDSFGSFSRAGSEAAVLERIAAWTRERFSLAAADAVLATQLACAVPGCPPLETVVAFWTADGQRHHFKVFKPAREVTLDDLPYAWMKRSLAASADDRCDCC